MSNLMIALFFAAGVAGWAYSKLVRSNGNPTPYVDLSGAAIAGVMTFVIVYTFLKYILHFE